MKKILFACTLIFHFFCASANQQALWMRYPSISPDGKQIAFGYKGDIYLVPTEGGIAVPLTLHESHDMMPIWSHDGKHIAFASDRHGNFDVFMIASTGGTPTRLTFHSANDFPQDFSNNNQEVLFTSARIPSAKNIRFHSPRLFQNLYKVAVHGGRSVLLSDAGMSVVKISDDQQMLVFQDRKGYEDLLRKHHTSSVTRDIWTLDFNTKQFQKISNFEGEDLEPCFAPNRHDIYFLSEKSGTLNVWVHQQGKLSQITHFEKNPIRHLSISQQETICFTYEGQIYYQKKNQTPQRVNILIQNDGRQSVEKNMSVTNQLTEFSVAPNGKEIAFINRGEVFVTSIEGAQTKRITNTPQQERHICWAPDSRSLFYATERGQSWDIYQTTLQRPDEFYFYASTTLKESAVLATAEEEYQPHVSPDGKELAYVAERNSLKVINLNDNITRTLLPLGRNYSYSDGDWDFSWSPDSKYILSDDGEGNWFTGNVALLNKDGNAPIEHPVPSGYGQSNVKWAMNGKAMTWVNAKAGRKSLALQGSREVDIYIGFFDVPEFDKFILSKEDFALWKEKEDKLKTEATSTTKTSKKNTSKKNDSTAKFTINAQNVKDRIKRLTIHSCSISDYAITPDGSKVYYLAAFEKGFDLWVTEPRTHDTKILAKLGGGGGQLQLSKDGKTIFVLKDGGLLKIDENGKNESIAIRGEMILNSTQERAYILEHAYRQVAKKFYDPMLHGLDWKGLYEFYANFLPHINNNYDFQELLSEFLGELNASHTGGRYSPQFPNGDATASLGLLYDETQQGEGLLVTEVIKGGPFDMASSKLKSGARIAAIDGIRITDSIDWNQLLNRKADKNCLVTFTLPNSINPIEEVIKPISMGTENSLLYKRWIERMNQMTLSLSKGKIGYVHVTGMNDGSFRDVYDEVLGQHYAKKALIVDTRFNGGGWLHDDLKTFLSGKRYLDFAPQGHRLNDGEPMGRWTKPSCVLMSEGNYSDAFIFPYVYQQASIGKLIGMPVPGTGTAVWWETQIDPTLVFGIPMIATLGKENRPTENLQVEPDIKVALSYDDFLQGKDPQLETAVKELLKQVK